MAVHIHDGDELGEGDEGEAGGSEAVEESEPVLARPGGEHQPDHEAAHLNDNDDYNVSVWIQKTQRILIIKRS